MIENSSKTKNLVVYFRDDLFLEGPALSTYVILGDTELCEQRLHQQNIMDESSKVSGLERLARQIGLVQAKGESGPPSIAGARKACEFVVSHYTPGDQVILVSRVKHENKELFYHTLELTASSLFAGAPPAQPQNLLTTSTERKRYTSIPVKGVVIEFAHSSEEIAVLNKEMLSRLPESIEHVICANYTDDIQSSYSTTRGPGGDIVSQERRFYPSIGPCISSAFMHASKHLIHYKSMYIQYLDEKKPVWTRRFPESPTQPPQVSQEPSPELLFEEPVSEPPQECEQTGPRKMSRYELQLYRWTNEEDNQEACLVWRTPPLPFLLQHTDSEPRVKAAGQLSPTLPNTPTDEYTFLRTLPRRHRPIRDRVNEVGSHLRGWLAHTKPFSLSRRPPLHQPHKTNSRNAHPHNISTSSQPTPTSDIVLSPTSNTNLQPSTSLFALDEFELSSDGTCEQTSGKGDETVFLPEDESSLPNSRVGSSAAVASALATGSSAATANGSSVAAGGSSTPAPGAVEPPAAKQKPDLGLGSPSARPTYVNLSAPLHAMPDPTDEHLEPIVPSQLVQGTPMLKVTPNKMRQQFFRLDPDQGLVTWESEKAGIIYIENIKEIRMGEEARYYREQFKQTLDREDRWMTIVYTSDNKYKILHVIAYSRETALVWHQTLNSLRALRRNVMSGLVSSTRVWERHYWRGADMSKDERLEIEEVERLCRRLNLAIGKKDLADRFKSADKGGKGYLDFSDFQQFVKTLQARPELKRLWNRLRGEGLFDLEVFENFLKEEQKCDLPQDEVQRLFSKHASGGVESPSSPIETATPGSPTVCSYPDKPQHSTATGLISTTLLATPPPPHFTLGDFSRFLLSADCAAFGDAQHDMTRPLSEYYIFSSHNTYFVGNQLVEGSPIEGYIRALGCGCRSIEMNVWDGDHEPVIRHGRTLTGSVPLRHVAHAIAKYAFVASPYPVIISAEMHAGIEQQTMVAAIFKEAFGAALVTAPIDGSPWSGPGDLEELDQLPSPEMLKGRVLVKFKNALPSEAQVATSDVEHELSLVKRATRSFWPQKQPNLVESHSLLDLSIYIVDVEFRGLDKERYSVVQAFNLSERNASHLLKQNCLGLAKNCQTHLVWSYPNGTKATYELLRYWAAGVQLVAIDWQAFDLWNIINWSMFRRNARAGYLLKPESLRGKDKELLSKRTDYVLEITIISAQHIPRRRDENGREIIKDSIMDPSVEVSLHVPDWPSAPDSDVRSAQGGIETHTYRTTAVKENGLNPIWEESVLIPFTCMGDMLDLIFVQFAVLDNKDNDGPLAMHCASLGSLRKGYRHLPLHDLQFSQYLFSTLFVHVSLLQA